MKRVQKQTEEAHTVRSVLESLNSQQRMAVEKIDGPVLILAGAGSGKTRVLTVRIAYMIQECGISPRSILAMTFTRKAAGEMQNRIQKLIGPKVGLWIGTFHSIFARILRWEAQWIGYSPDFVIYDKEDQEQLIKTLLDEQGYSSREISPRAISAIISRAKNQLVGPEMFRNTAGNKIEKIAGEIYLAYQKALRARHAFDYDDLITVPIDLFQQYPQVLEKYQNRFQYLLVDEYQDTNRGQYVLISLLAQRHRNLCVVGDDDQSIYGWRGADLRNILEFEKDFPETMVFFLEQNYRSTQTILKAASSVVHKNVFRKPKTLWSSGKDGEPLEIIEAENEQDEARLVVTLLQKEVLRKKRHFGDFVILYRINAQSRALEEELRRQGIPYIIVGGVRFYERKEIKDILAYLKLISNSKDTLSLKRIINFPLRGIGDTSLMRIEQWANAQGLDLFDALGRVEEIPDIPTRTTRNVKQFYDLIRKYTDLKNVIGPDELVHALVDEIGLLKLYKDEGPLKDQSRLENILEFLNAVHEYAQETDEPSLSEFLERVALITEIDVWNSQSSTVTLMTLHCAKGLEFPVVFIVGLEEGLFPISRSLEIPSDLEEERRLFYVGLTRAKEKVFLSHARYRNIFNSELYRTPSRFLDEIDPSVLQTFRGEKKLALSKKYEAPSPKEKIKTLPLLRPGVWVEHEVYGKGEVIKIHGEGPRQVCEVQFHDGERKKFLVQFARFHILG